MSTTRRGLFGIMAGAVTALAGRVGLARGGVLSTEGLQLGPAGERPLPFIYGALDPLVPPLIVPTSNGTLGFAGSCAIARGNWWGGITQEVGDAW